MLALKLTALLIKVGGRSLRGIRFYPYVVARAFSGIRYKVLFLSVSLVFLEAHRS